MAGILKIATLAALVAVAVVLAMGLITLARGRSAGRSNRLMWARVITQAVALILLGLLWLTMVGGS